MALDPVVSAMFSGLAKEERDGVSSAFGSMLVDPADGVWNISPERNGGNVAVVTSFPPILPKEFAIMMPSKLSLKLSFRFGFLLEKPFGDSKSTDPCAIAIEIHYSKTCWIR
jgi:hypothetical protein